VCAVPKNDLAIAAENRSEIPTLKNNIFEESNVLFYVIQYDTIPAI
jgi:hypothetical protein